MQVLSKGEAPYYDDDEALKLNQPHDLSLKSIKMEIYKGNIWDRVFRKNPGLLKSVGPQGAG